MNNDIKMKIHKAGCNGWWCPTTTTTRHPHYLHTQPRAKIHFVHWFGGVDHQTVCISFCFCLFVLVSYIFGYICIK